MMQMPSGGMPTQQQVQEQQAKAQAMEEQRKELLQKVLTPEANDRLARIALVKPDKVRFARSRSCGAASLGLPPHAKMP